MNNPPDPIFNDFLLAQLKAGLQLANSSDLVTVTPIRGMPPTQYVIELRCRGLVKDARGEIVESAGPFGFGVNFPANYLRGGFHPAEVLAFLNHNMLPWHPNLNPPFVCLDIPPAFPLTEIIHTLFDFTTWNLFSTSDEGLNKAASQWYRNQDPARFPIDRRPLKRRVLNLNVKPENPDKPADPAKPDKPKTPEDPKP